MTQKPSTVRIWIATIVAGVALATQPIRAQDDQPDPAPAAPTEVPPETVAPQAVAEPSEERIRFAVDLGVWVAQPTGLELEPASVTDPFDPFGTTIDDFDPGTEAGGQYRFAVDFGHGNGGIEGTWWSSSSEPGATETQPSNFVFGEILAYPEYAGYSNDGLADGYDALADVSIRDLRIDYYRTAFESSRISARWFVGYRAVQFDRTLDVDYFAFEPLIPPLFPPIVDDPIDLAPEPDSALVSSRFEGRGLEGGLALRVPLSADGDLAIEGSFVLAALRGDIDTEYRSTNSYYELNGTILEPPYDEFSDPVLADQIIQVSNSIGVKTENRSTSASVLSIDLALRWRFFHTLEVFAGFRSARYDDVAVELRPAAPIGTNRQFLTEESRSATYEGFFLGLTVGF